MMSFVSSAEFGSNRHTEMKTLFLILASLTANAASVNVAWDAPNDPSVTGYVVRYGPSSTNKIQTVNVGNTNLVSVTVPDNIQVYMDVVSYNGIGLLSLPSNEINFSTIPPKAPASIRLTNNAVVVTVTIAPGQ